jgi:hypothetical protein
MIAHDSLERPSELYRSASMNLVRLHRSSKKACWAGTNGRRASRVHRPSTLPSPANDGQGTLRASRKIARTGRLIKVMLLIRTAPRRCCEKVAKVRDHYRGTEVRCVIKQVTHVGLYGCVEGMERASIASAGRW